MRLTGKVPSAAALQTQGDLQFALVEIVALGGSAESALW